MPAPPSLTASSIFLSGRNCLVQVWIWGSFARSLRSYRWLEQKQAFRGCFGPFSPPAAGFRAFSLPPPFPSFPSQDSPNRHTLFYAHTSPSRSNANIWRIPCTHPSPSSALLRHYVSKHDQTSLKITILLALRGLRTSKITTANAIFKLTKGWNCLKTPKWLNLALHTYIIHRESSNYKEISHFGAFMGSTKRLKDKQTYYSKCYFQTHKGMELFENTKMAQSCITHIYHTQRKQQLQRNLSFWCFHELNQTLNPRSAKSSI